jgi:hypothetical protein
LGTSALCRVSKSLSDSEMTPNRSRVTSLCGVLSFAVLLICVSTAKAQDFLPRSLDANQQVDELKNGWYSKNLEALREPVFFKMAGDSSKECYRFLWLRSFNHPVSVRLCRESADKWKLTTKVAGGAAGFHPGALILDESNELYNPEVEPFLARIDTFAFWSAPNPVNDQTGTDGSQWVIEGVKNGKYHIVDRWTPKDGVARELGWYLVFNLAHLEVTKDDVY